MLQINLIIKVGTFNNTKEREREREEEEEEEEARKRLY
jgi:hypothetical protein